MEKDELLHRREDLSPRQRFARFFPSGFKPVVFIKPYAGLCFWPVLEHASPLQRLLHQSNCIGIILLLIFLHSGLCGGFIYRKVTKESLVETSSNITESLMSISRMMAEQVKQSEDAIGLLGKEHASKLALCSRSGVKNRPRQVMFLPIHLPPSLSPYLPISQLPPREQCRKPTRSLKT